MIPPPHPDTNPPFRRRRHHHHHHQHLLLLHLWTHPPNPPCVMSHGFCGSRIKESGSSAAFGPAVPNLTAQSRMERTQ